MLTTQRYLIDCWAVSPAKARKEKQPGIMRDQSANHTETSRITSKEERQPLPPPPNTNSTRPSPPLRHMLQRLRADIPLALSPGPPPIRAHKIPQRQPPPPRQPVIPALQLLQVLIPNQPLLPQMLKQVEIGSRGGEALAKRKVVLGQMRHFGVPGGGSGGGAGVVAARGSPVAERTGDGARGVCAVEVGARVRFPLLSVAGEEVAGEEPEDATVQRGWGGEEVRVD